MDVMLSAGMLCDALSEYVYYVMLSAGILCDALSRHVSVATPGLARAFMTASVTNLNYSYLARRI